MKLTGNLRAAENVAVAGEIYCHNGFLFLVIKVDPKNDVCSCIQFDHRGNIETVVTMDREEFRNAPYLGHVNLKELEISVRSGRAEEDLVLSDEIPSDAAQSAEEQERLRLEKAAQERRERRLGDMALVTPSPNGRS